MSAAAAVGSSVRGWRQRAKDGRRIEPKKSGLKVRKAPELRIFLTTDLPDSPIADRSHRDKRHHGGHPVDEFSLSQMLHCGEPHLDAPAPSVWWETPG